MNRKMILVVGATGAQGGSVAKALLKDGNHKVRVFTRNRLSEKALALARAGAEVFEGDLDDPDSIRKALEDCYGVFGVTSYWEHFDKEFDHGKNLVEAVREAGIRHFVFSTLPDYNHVSKRQFCVPEYDIKATLERYTRRLDIPTTFLHLSYYYENFLDFLRLQEDGKGGYYFGNPQGDTPLAMVSVEDIGRMVATIFDFPVEYIGRTVGAVGDIQTSEDYSRILSKELGLDVHYRRIPRSEYANMNIPGAKEMANVFEVQRLFVSNRQIEMIESYGLNPSMLDFRTWVRKNRRKFAEAYDLKTEAMVA